MNVKQLLHHRICIGASIKTVFIIISPVVLVLLIINTFNAASEFMTIFNRTNYQQDKSLAHYLENDTNSDIVSSRQRDLQKDGLENVNATIRTTPTVIKALTNKYDQRLVRAQQLCFGTKPGSVLRVMVDKTKKMANCVIPKAGCTFWINIFRFINNETNGVVYQSPLQIPRWMTHYSKKSKEYSFRQIEEAPTFLKQAYRFMFVRDPYKRLWASWIDKFLLPDYWFTKGREIARKKNMGTWTQKCPINITFVDFIEFITDDYFMRHPQKLNEHWKPYHLSCDPCLFRPHFIGKMESFEEDVNFVLAKTNLSTINLNLDSQKNEQTRGQVETLTPTKEEKKRDEYILHEMDFLAQYTFDGVWRTYSKHIKTCVSQHFLAQRLWLAFQLNGYIPQDSPLQLTSMTTTAWYYAIRDAYSKWDKDSTKRFQTQKEQKRNARKAAYQKVPLDMMIKLQGIFDDDFKQFGYDAQPESLFKRNQQTSNIRK